MEKLSFQAVERCLHTGIHLGRWSIEQVPCLVVFAQTEMECCYVFFYVEADGSIAGGFGFLQRFLVVKESTVGLSLCRVSGS